MTLTLQPVAVACGEDGDGLLVFADGVFVALLVRLSQEHGRMSGAWFLEVGLGRLEVQPKPVFQDLQTAQDWLVAHLSENPLDSRFQRSPIPPA